MNEFTVILVDDDMPAMNGQIREIKQYLKENKQIDKLNFYTIPVEDESYLEQIDSHLKKHVDLVLTDNSMLNEDDGLKLTKKVREESMLIDILLYSAKPIEKEDYRDLSHYLQIQTHDNKQITEITKDLIDRNLSKWDDTIFLRGIIISESIEIELKIDLILTEFFEIPEEKKTSFENLILGNFSISLEVKKAELKAVLTEAKLEELGTDIFKKIGNLQKNRNKLAHGKVDPQDHRKFITGKSQEVFDKEKMISISSDIKDIKEKLSEIEKKLTLKIDDNNIESKE